MINDLVSTNQPPMCSSTACLAGLVTPGSNADLAAHNAELTINQQLEQQLAATGGNSSKPNPALLFGLNLAALGVSALALAVTPIPGLDAGADIAASGLDATVISEDTAALGAEETDTADAATSCLNSFTGDTPVTMADGSTKSIKDVEVGDKVLATDPTTGKTEAEQVVQLIRHSGQHAMVLINLADGSVLDSTDGHPIWDATTGRFTDAGQLHVGDKIETTNDALLTISGLTTYSADLTAYNLQIDQIHTYYAGTTPILVHNSCGPLTTAQARQMAERVGYRATNQTLRGQRVFTNGKNYIVQDIDSHSGGLWKMADTIRGLGSKSTRFGTYDYDLEYIGP